MLSQEIVNNLEKIHQSILVVDIETSSFYPENGGEVSIKTEFDAYVANAKVKWFGAFSYKYNQGYYLHAQNDASQILKLMNEHDVIVHFNGEEFDFPILTNNGFTNDQKRYIQVDCMQILGTSNQRNRKGYAFKNRAELMDVKLKNNHLRGMAESFELETQKGNIDWRVFQKDEWTEAEIIDIKKYLYADVMATKQLFDRLWYYWLPFAELLPEKSIYDLSWIRSSIASLTYKAACQIINVEPTYSENGRTAEEMGGNVFEPKIEEAWGAWYVDYGSLYPHVEAMFNLCSEVPEDKKDRNKIWHGNDIFQVKGYYDVSSWHPLSSYIASKLKERIHLKETDKQNPMVYTLKILLNSFYGVLRSPIFEKVHTENIGWDTCWLSQQIQQLSTEMLEQFGFKIIYGDTDSVLFITDDKEKNTKEYVSSCLNQIVEIIKDNVPFPVDTFKLNIEHYLEYIMFPFDDATIVGEDGKNKKENGRLVYERKGKKKNYFFIYKDKDETKIKIVGLPIKKDNATQLGMKIYEEVLKDEIIKNNRAKFSKDFIDSVISNYLKKPEIIQLLSQEYKVNASSSYKTNCIQKQISDAYFNGQEGVIRLVKNSKIGKCGKGTLYATVEEATNAKLVKEDFDLDKVEQELSPFVLYVEPPKPAVEAPKPLKIAPTGNDNKKKEESTVVPKKRGRKPGSKNKPKFEKSITYILSF